MCNEKNGVNTQRANITDSLRVKGHVRKCLKTRKCYSIGESEGEFYIGSFALLTFIESVRLALNELVQYKTAYVELAVALPNAVTFSSNI